MSPDDCDDSDCECACHETDDEEASVCDSIDLYFQPATSGWSHNKDYSALLSTGLESIESAIDGQRGDPGKLYPLHERVRRVIGALQARARR